MWAFARCRAPVKKLDDAGVIVNAGSHGHVIGLALHWEMWLLAQGGMSNMSVLRSATLNGARTHGLEKQLGSLEPGKLADIIVLDKNPLEDIQNSNSVRYTMVNGRLVRREHHERDRQLRQTPRQVLPGSQPRAERYRLGEVMWAEQ